MRAPAPAIRSSATPSSPRSKNRAASARATGWQPLPIVVDGADGTPAAIAPGLCQEPQPGRICLRPWLGRCVGARGRALLSQAADRRAVHARCPGPRLLLRDAGARARADRRARGGDRPERAVLGARHLHRARPGAAVRGGRLADPRRARSSTGRTTAMPASTISSPRSPAASARRSARSAPPRSRG